jgi:hypothetical protein
MRLAPDRTRSCGRPLAAAWRVLHSHRRHSGLGISGPSIDRSYRLRATPRSRHCRARQPRPLAAAMLGRVTRCAPPRWTDRAKRGSRRRPSKRIPTNTRARSQLFVGRRTLKHACSERRRPRPSQDGQFSVEMRDDVNASATPAAPKRRNGSTLGPAADSGMAAPPSRPHRRTGGRTPAPTIHGWRAELRAPSSARLGCDAG